MNRWINEHKKKKKKCQNDTKEIRFFHVDRFLEEKKSLWLKLKGESAEPKSKYMSRGDFLSFSFCFFCLTAVNIVINNRICRLVRIHQSVYRFRLKTDQDLKKRPSFLNGNSCTATVHVRFGDPWNFPEKKRKK